MVVLGGGAVSYERGNPVQGGGDLVCGGRRCDPFEGRDPVGCPICPGREQGLDIASHFGRKRSSG